MLARAPLNFTSNEQAHPQSAALLTAAEKAILTLADITIWLDWKRVSVDGQNYIYQWVSRKLDSNGREQWVGVSADTKGLVFYPATDSQSGIRSGYLADGTVNTNRTSLQGNTCFVLPSGSWYVADVGLQELPTSIGVRWATSGSGTRIGRGLDVNGRIRRWYNYSAGLSQSVATGVEDAALALIEDTWDGTTWVSYKNRTSVVSSAPTMATAADLRIRLNSIDNGSGGDTSLQKGYRETFIVGSPTTAARNAVRDLVAERHPGLSLA